MLNLITLDTIVVLVPSLQVQSIQSFLKTFFKMKFGTILHITTVQMSPRFRTAEVGETAPIPH